MAVTQILADLDGAVTRSKTVMAGAATLIRGIKAKIEAAVATALANGATEAELQPFTALDEALDASATDLAAAVAENTAAASEPPVEPPVV